MQRVFVYNLQYKKLKKPDDKEIIEVNKDNSLFNWSDQLTEGDIFISLDHKSPLDFRLEYYNIPYNSLVIATKNNDLEDLLKDNNMQEHFTEDYSIFSGKRMNVINRDTKVSILRSIKLLSDIMYQMLEAGYLEQKNYKKIDDWILSFEEPILKLFKIYHGFEKVDLNEATKLLTVGTSNSSVDFEEEFLINPQFRQMLTIMLMKIISNFIINNNMVTLETVSELGDWQDKEVWKKLRKKVKLLK